MHKPPALTVADLLDPVKQEKIAPALAKYMGEGGCYQELFKISADDMEEKYAAGVELFKKEDFTGASEVFSVLTMVSPYVKKYWTALGSTTLKLKEYDLAIIHYDVASTLDEKDPELPFMMAYGYVKLKQTKEAKEALERTVTLAKKDHAHRSLEDKAGAFLKQLASEK